VVSDRKLVNDPLNFVNFTPDVLSYNDHYPFGMLLPNRHGSTDNYRYGFQGQEKDDEIKGEGNSLNFTFRMYDPRVGRFFAIDPLAQRYPWNSSYAFSENRVLDRIELEGLESQMSPWYWYNKWRKEGPLLERILAGGAEAAYEGYHGLKWMVQNPKEAAKGTGNLLLGVIVSGASGPGGTPDPFQLIAVDQMLGTNTYESMGALAESINQGVDVIIDGDVVERSKLGFTLLFSVVGTKGTDKIIQISKVRILSKLPKSKTLQYIAGEHKYLYTTDKSSRILIAETDNLKLKTHEGRLAYDPNTPGKISGDHAGHLFADLFGGDPTLKNLVSQASNVNQSAFRTIENVWKKAIEAGKKVEVKIKLKYDGDSVRPNSFDVTYKIDGKIYNQVIENKNP
jgi:RHS repeat-associated protein